MKKHHRKYLKLIPITLAAATVTGVATALAVKAVKKRAAQKNVQAEPDVVEATRPAFSAIYSRSGCPNGYATGTVKVTLDLPAEEAAERRIIMYWANEAGKLEGYTPLPLLKVQGEETTYTIGRNVLIPEGATKLLVYTADVEGNLSEESVTLEDVYEPYLMQLGFLTRTPRGRCVTALAYEHLHIAFDGQAQFSI